MKDIRAEIEEIWEVEKRLAEDEYSSIDIEIEETISLFSSLESQIKEELRKEVERLESSSIVDEDGYDTGEEAIVKSDVLNLLGEKEKE